MVARIWQRTTLNFEYGVVLLMLRNMIQISFSRGLSCVNLWDIEKKRLDTTISQKYRFVAKRAIFLDDDYLLRRDSGSKVVQEEVPDSNTNSTSLDKNSVPIR